MSVRPGIIFWGRTFGGGREVRGCYSQCNCAPSFEHGCCHARCCATTGAIVRKPVEIPQLKIFDNFVDMCTVVLRQVRIVRIEQNLWSFRSCSLWSSCWLACCCATIGVYWPDRAEACGDSTVEVLGHASYWSRQMAMVLTVRTPLEILQLQFLDKVVDMPAVVQQQVHDYKNSGANCLPTSTALVVAVHQQGRRHPWRGAEASPCGLGDAEDVSDSTAALHRQGGRCHRVQVVQVHRQDGRCPTWCRSCRFHRCRSWRGQSS